MASPEKAQQGEIALPTGPRSLNGQRSSSEKAPCASPLWRALLLTALLLSPVLPILLGLRPLPFPVPFALHRSCHNENRDFINASPIDSWLAAESRYAYTQMLSNIGGGEDVTSNATSVPGAPAGTVVASPSTEAPDYYYSWLRDGALTMAVVIDLFVKGESNLDDFIQEYVGVEQTHQANDRGDAGEPKFEVNGDLFTGPWGRPQRDGPALRATALMKYARAKGLDSDVVKQVLYVPSNMDSVIKSDLEYVAHNWTQRGFDLWEEVDAYSFFTLAVQWRALVEGAAFAYDMRDPGAGDYYAQEAERVLEGMQAFWIESDNYVHSFLFDDTGRSGLDAAVLLAAIHTFNSTQGTDTRTFQPGSERILATHKGYVDAFRNLYPLNANAKLAEKYENAVAVGRYPEDVYNGVGTSIGNPWFLTTAAAAEVLYDALYAFDRAGYLLITSISQPFFAQFNSSISAPQNLTSSSDSYKNLTSGIRAYADGFMGIIEEYARTNGSLPEEFDRTSGAPSGARDLTWSYASLITANAARDGNPVLPV